MLGKDGHTAGERHSLLVRAKSARLTRGALSNDVPGPELRGFGLDRVQRGQKTGIVTVVERQSVVDRLALGAARRTTPADTPALLQHPNVDALLAKRACAGQAGDSRADDQGVGQKAIFRSRVACHEFLTRIPFRVRP